MEECVRGYVCMRAKWRKKSIICRDRKRERKRGRESEKGVCVCATHEVIDEGEFYSLDAIIFRCTIVMLSLSLCHCFWYCYCYYRYRHGCSTACVLFSLPSPCFLMQWLYFVYEELISHTHFLLLLLLLLSIAVISLSLCFCVCSTWTVICFL